VTIEGAIWKGKAPEATSNGVNSVMLIKKLKDLAAKVSARNDSTNRREKFGILAEGADESVPGLSLSPRLKKGRSSTTVCLDDPRKGGK